MDQAIAGVLFGIFSSTGQSCIAGSRLFVQASVFDAFVARLVERTKALRVGHPEDAATQVAPLIRPAHRDSVAAHVAAALAEGATLLVGGAAPEGELYARGSYYLPTILTGVANTARICREEVFGPVLAVLPFRDEADLLAQANDSVYGLAAGIWSNDYRRIWRVARALEAGTVWINTYKQFSISTPFGGWKASGPGLEKGRLGIRGYLRQKSLYWDLSGAPIGWAG
jgi:acyl-CoA reductase-like NAD-dependent aldehyde dehydrogenase